MTPLEINKKIAKLKNILAYQNNWAEDIGDAWELFEEMPWPKMIADDRYNGTYSGGKCLCGCGDTLCLDEEFMRGPNGSDYDCLDYWSKDYQFRHFHSADTYSLAICKAWIAWKTGKAVE